MPHIPKKFRRHRAMVLHSVWIALSAILIGRLFGVMAFPHPSGLGVRFPRGSASEIRWRMDAEHFQTALTSDARGRILFRDGTVWSASANVGGERIGPELVGKVGKPDVWPNSVSTVPEQGRGGMEAAWNDQLTGGRPGVTGHMMLAGGQDERVSSGTFTLTPLRGEDITTTIDRVAERQAEQLLRSYSVRHGSIVSLTLPKHDIRVLASANHDRSDALMAVTPGSVFKIVTAAAALETHVISRRTAFVCDGVVHLPHVRMRCWRVHGKLSFVDAIAQSCDSAFAHIGVNAGRRALEKQSARFGLSQTGLAPVRGGAELHADAGVVFRQRGEDEGLLANTAIGQEDVRITPLQGALVAATVASNGVYEPGRLVEDNGPTSAVRACESYSAYVLSTGMWKAVHDPLGTLYALHDLPLYAKSGTAELGHGRVNAWMIGYRVQQGHPISAFAICVENERSDQAHKKLIELARSWFQRV